MEIEARLIKKSKQNEPDWLVSIDILNSHTQGYTRDEAIKMATYLILDLMDVYFGEEKTKGVKIDVRDFGRSRIGLSCSKPDLLISLILIRQKEAAGITVREAARRIVSSFQNSYSAYKRGKRRPSIVKIDQLLHAINPDIPLSVMIKQKIV
jgi:predicted RNase H-like HicB family nuclease